MHGARPLGAAGLVCAGLLGGLTLAACPHKDEGSREPAVARAVLASERVVSPPPVAPADPGTAPASSRPRVAPRVQVPSAVLGAAELIELLRNKKVLRTLAPPENTAAAGGSSVNFGPFDGLVPGFSETVHDENNREFEGTNSDGPVRAVTLTFAPLRVGGWRFHSVAIRVHSDDPPRAFAELRARAIAVLRKPKWMDLGGLGRTAWSLGEYWELTVAVLQGGEIQLRSGLPARN